MNRKAIIIVILILLALCSTCLAGKLTVPNQYPTIQAAIDAADDDDSVVILPGTYTGEGNREIDFLGKAITVRSADPNDPNVVSATIINCSDEIGSYTGFNFLSGEDANSILAGFTITKGEAIKCFESSPTITNCIITNSERGIYCYGSPTITNCNITGNSCGAEGGVIYCYRGDPMIVANCVISNNNSFGRGGDGGGISVREGLCLIYDSIISGNTANRGSGIYCDYGGSAKVIDCAITGNSAQYVGGGICLHGGSSSVTIKGCTITDNSVEGDGGGIYLRYTSDSLTVTDSIIWGNTDSSGTGQSAQIYGDRPDVWFSCIQDDDPDDANIPFGADKYNIDDDPCFVVPGYWDSSGLWHKGDYHLLPRSPCIETGNPFFTYHPGDLDIDGQSRLMGRCVDMGADEFEIKMIIVTKPKGGEVWTAGSAHEINWDSFNITGTVDISYSTNNGIDWIKIDSVADTGNYIWHLPYAVDSNQCRILVEPNTPVTNLICTKSEPFTIQPYRNLPPVPWWPGYQQMKFGPRFGCVKWKFETDGPVTAGVAIGCFNRIHIPCEDGKLYTLSASGKLLWAYDTNSPLVSTPAVDHSGTVYVGAENGKLYAIDRRGRLLWTHTTDGPIYSSPVVLFDDSLWQFSYPPWQPWPWEKQVDIFVGSVDGTLYALEQDGSELWSFETDGGSAIAAGAISPFSPWWYVPLVPLSVTTGAIFASPVIDHNGSVYIAGTYDPNLYALDTNNIDLKWNHSFTNQNLAGRRPWPFASPVIAEDGTIYQALLYDPNLYAIDPNNGSIIWALNLADPCSGWFETDYIETYGPASCWSKPVIAADGTIYISLNDPYLRAVDPNGTIKWVTRLGMMGSFTLTVGGNGLIYAACDDGCLYVVDDGGEEIARFESGGSLSFPMITQGRTIIVSDANNAIWAIGPYHCWGRPLVLHRPEDLNGDGNVDSLDLDELTADWLGCTDYGSHCNYYGNLKYLKGDMNKDFYVDFADFTRLANRWLNKE